eukprot:NODE_3806_length_729_cov_145.489706_g3208_i0.p1 GENE.NODE_3806_length_729_cov_145.489706_g3208_i0~~NODE_3806_length_729_cov_145.489706_g3208_i0.p1  ORF type:complete len:213 (+),score=42.29 NODE_3806_length_729_cov_145.489706_g3208_i0:27-641(+)
MGYGKIPCFPGRLYWRMWALILTGFIGGIFSAISGSGIDICSFSVLTLLFRVTEKTATPTSVCLMAINTVVGFIWREYPMGGVKDAAWGYLYVCVPFVVIGAPLGSVLGSHFHRLVLAAFVYVTDTVQLVAAWIILGAQGKLTTSLTIASICTIIGGWIFFTIEAKLGEYLMTRYEAERAEALGSRNNSVSVDLHELDNRHAPS